MGVTTRAKKKANTGAKENSSKSGIFGQIRQFFSLKNLLDLIFDPSKGLVMAVALLLAEVVINIVIIEKVKYTEIDWKAYMQEVKLNIEL